MASAAQDATATILPTAPAGYYSTLGKIKKLGKFDDELYKLWNREHKDLHRLFETCPDSIRLAAIFSSTSDDVRKHLEQFEDDVGATFESVSAELARMCSPSAHQEVAKHLEALLAISQGSSDLRRYVSDVDRVISQLEVHGINIPDALTCHLTLRGLASDHHRTALALQQGTSDGEDRTYEMLRLHLNAIHANELIRQPLSISNPIPAAAVTTATITFAPCTHCGKAGHTKDKCWELYPNLRVTCPKCGRRGHLGSECKNPNSRYKAGRGRRGPFPQHRSHGDSMAPQSRDHGAKRPSCNSNAAMTTSAAGTETDFVFMLRPHGRDNSPHTHGADSPLSHNL